MLPRSLYSPYCLEEVFSELGFRYYVFSETHMQPGA